jgi:hypothetical protein
MKKIFNFLACLLCGCVMEQNSTIDVYKLEKYNGSEVPVCINYQQEVKVVKEGWYDTDDCGNEVYIPAQYESIKNSCNATHAKVVSYDYCLERLPKPSHLVEKKKDDMTICYDRNNKVELPILYCQKDMVNIQTVSIR